jgi:CRISPR/Cas system-associated exonuclease Cas4 (RecB family)
MSRDARDSAIEHLSVSQAKSCLARVAFERIAGIIEKPSAAMDFGSYVHALAEAAYSRSTFPAPIPQGMNRRTVEAAQRLFAEYWNRIGSKITENSSVQAEQRFEFTGWTKRPIVGYVDLVYSVNDVTVPADLKTKSASPEAIRADEKLQLTTYRVALGLPIPGPAELHVLSTESDGEIYTLEADENGNRGISAEDVERARLRFVALDAAWETRRFPPEPSKLCQYCPAYPQCRAGKLFDGDIDKWIQDRAATKPPATKTGVRKEQVMLPEAKKVEVELEDSQNIRPYLKVALVGPYGTLKTRTALGFPAPVMVDTERGTDHYGKEFKFKRLRLQGESKEYFGRVTALLKQLGADPGKCRTFEVDSWSVYCERVESAFADIFLRTEDTSKGNKKEYYTLQPRDYKPIHRELMKQMNAMLRLNMHVVVTMQEKDKWAAGDELKVIGTTFDGYKRTPHFFDTVIFIKKVADPKTGQERFVGTVEKDRTHCLPNRIDPFSIEKLREYWGKYFEQESAPTENVMEEPVIVLPSAPVPAAPAPAAPAAPAPPSVAAPAAPAAPAATAAAAVIEEPAAPPLKAEQLAALLELRNLLQIPDDKWTAILDKRGVKKADKLKVQDIVGILGKLEEKLSPTALQGWIKLHPFRAPGR